MNKLSSRLPGVGRCCARDLTEQGLPTVMLSRLVAAGKLERIARGVYSLPGRALSEHRSLAEVALRVPRGVVCLLSALRVHGIGTQAPFEVWMAIPHHSPTPRLGQPALRLDVALEALRDGWSQRKLAMDALWHYARVNRVANVMRPYLESVTA